MTVYRIEEADPYWFESSPYRSYAHLLLRETGLHWRLLAAHLQIPSAAMAKLLTCPTAHVHSLIATKLMTAASDEITELRRQRVPAAETRVLYRELQALNIDLSPWLSSHDQHHLNSTAIYVPRTLHDQVAATHELAHQQLNGRVTPTTPTLQSV